MGSDGMKWAASSRAVPDCEGVNSSSYTIEVEREEPDCFATTVPKHTDATLYSRKKSGFRVEGSATRSTV